MGTLDRLRMFAATPISEELCALIERLEPRVTMIRDQALLPPQKHPADHTGDAGFTRSAEEQARFDEFVNTADALYGLPDQSPSALHRVVESNPRLRWVHATPAGGGAQVKAARLTAEQLERVVFTTSAGLHAGPLSEFALFGVFAGAKSLPTLWGLQARKEWGERWLMGQVSEQTVLVVGLGGIGRMTAARLSALGAHVIGMHRHPVAVPGVERVAHIDSFPDVAATADAIVMALPATESTHHLLSRAVLARVKPGVTVVNVGRGSTIDEVALIEALADGRVGFAALDVFEHEPLATESPLWSMPNVLISPHTAAVAADEELRMATFVAANATRLLDGIPLANRVDTIEFY